MGRIADNWDVIAWKTDHMLMPVICVQCVDEGLARVGSIPEGGVPFLTKVVPVQTVGLYRTACSQGHDIVMIADFQQFELLFESAIEAFADAYFRESVSSFAAALERFYEFAIQTFLLAQGVSIETIDSTWKSVAAQSERQLGMFVGLYSSALKKPPKLLSSTEVKFRNDVIHKGHFPSPQEAFRFGNSVYSLLNVGLKELRTDFHDAMQKARQITRETMFSQLNPGEQPHQFGMGTTISLFVLDEPQPLIDAINTVASRLQRQRTSDASGSAETYFTQNQDRYGDL